MYNNGYAAAVVVNDKILRDTKGEGSYRNVFIEHNTEYKIFLKNTTNIGCGVSIFIDGKDALGNRKVILKAKETTYIERFVLDGNLEEGKKYKFIAVNSAEAREDGVDPTDPKNGIVTIKFYPEVFDTITFADYDWDKFPTTITKIYRCAGDGKPPEYELMSKIKKCRSGETMKGTIGHCIGGGEIDNYCKEVVNPEPAQYYNHTMGFMDCCAKMEYMEQSRAAQQLGATTEGSTSKQGFKMDHLRTSSYAAATINFKLMVNKVTISSKDKVYCSNCGIKVKPTAKFCEGCGTRLELPCGIRV